MTFSAVDDAHVCAGQPIEEAVAAVAHEVSAVGINCTDASLITGLLQRMGSVTDAPFVVYPNGGGVWNAETGQWVGASGGPFANVDAWRSLGASFIGGCCGTDAEAIRTLVLSAR
jgi:homocysteine S-methyltransferase